MPRFLRSAFALALVLGLGLQSPARAARFSLPSVGKSRPAAVATVSDRVWAQEVSDLAPDPAVRFGRLPNGMRYALMRNATPSGQASIRLRIGAGSLMETDAEQGLAHFLEHMAFNGSKNVPEGEMTKILERHGLAFGADTNASTAWTETVYKLDLPHADDDTVDTSLMLLRETAGNLLISPEAVEHERGVILAEERARDTPGYRVFKLREAFVLKNQLAARRLPIGQIEVVRKAPAALIAGFYAKYYRPDRATLVVVGDFDIDAMEAKIKARFSDWAPKGPPGPEPSLGAPAPRGLEAQVSVEPGSPLTLILSWLKPAEALADNRAKEQTDLIERIGFAVLNRRLERLARADDPPFIGAGAVKGDEFRSAEVTSFQVRAEPDTWKAALTAVEHEQRRMLQFGVRQDELDREIQELRTNLQANAAAAATRQTPALANMIVGSVDDREVVRSPAQDAELFEDLAKGVTVEAVNAVMRRAFDGQGPLIFVASPTALEGDDEGVKTAFKAAQAKPVDPPTGDLVKAWPYDHFGPPGEVAEQKDIADLGTVFVRFRNGVRLTVKPTKFRDDQILVQVRVGQGRRNLSWTGSNVAWMAGQAFIEGGLKQLSAEEMDRIMTARIVGASLGIDDDAFELSGTTRRDDFPTQLQLLTAYVTEPGFRPEAFARWRALGASLQDQYSATSGGVLRRDLPSLVRSGDPRWAFPSRQEIAAGKPDDLKALLRGVSPDEPIEVVVAGDVTIDKAIAEVAATFGALPPPHAHDAAPDRPIAFPAGTSVPVVLTHKGRADQGTGYIAWPTDDFYTDVNRTRSVRVLGYVLQLRLTALLRETQGATYSPSADTLASYIFPHYGFLAATVEMPKEKLDGFFRDVDRLAADLRDHEVSADELERAKDSRVEALQKSQQTNEYWIGVLGGAQTDPRQLDAIRSSVSGLERVTAADVRKAAQTYLIDAKAWRLKIVPEKDR